MHRRGMWVADDGVMRISSMLVAVALSLSFTANAHATKSGAVDLQAAKAAKDAKRYGPGAIVTRAKSPSGRIKETIVARPNGETTSVRRVVFVGPTRGSIHTTKSVTGPKGNPIRELSENRAFEKGEGGLETRRIDRTWDGERGTTKISSGEVVLKDGKAPKLLKATRLTGL